MNAVFTMRLLAGAFQGRVMVTVGSGDRERPLEMNYPFADEVQNRFYAFFDEPYKTFVATPSVIWQRMRPPRSIWMAIPCWPWWHR